MAYDFVQQRDAGTKARVSERQVIKTIEDQHKYDMPDQRRLFVAADYVSMPQSKPYSPLTKFAEALSEVKPQIMDYFAELKAEKNKEAFDQGKADAQAGMDESQIKDEWQRKGYLTTKGMLNGEDFGNKLMEDWKVANKEMEDPDGGGLKAVNFDDFYKDWWQQNSTSLSGKSPEFMNTFNKSFTKYLVKTRGDHIEYESKLKLDQQEATAGEHIYRIIKDTRTDQTSISAPFSIYDLEAAGQDIKAMYPNFTNARVDELLYSSAKRWAEDTGDASVLSVFKENHTDGTPGLHAKKINETTRFSSQIDNDINRINNEAWTAHQRDIEVQKQAREQSREEIYKEMFKNGADEESVQLGLKALYDKGYFKNVAEYNQELSAWTAIAKKAETKSQQLNSITLRTAINEGKRVTGKDVADALSAGELSWEGAKMVMSEIEQKTARDKTEANANRRLDKDILYNKAIERIKSFMPNPNPKDSNEWTQHQLEVAAAIYEFQTQALEATNKDDLMAIADRVLTVHKAVLPSNIPANHLKKKQ